MPTLVMMHGMTGTSEMMRPFAERYSLQAGTSSFHRLSLNILIEDIPGGGMKVEISQVAESYLQPNYQMLIIRC